MTFTAAVSASGIAVSGSVTFSDESHRRGHGRLRGGNTQTLVAGKATCTTSTGLTNAGSPYTVTATYPGVARPRRIDRVRSQQVQVASSVSVSSSPSPRRRVSPCISKATVTGAAPTGTVTFAVLDKNNVPYQCGGGSNSLHLTAGAATCTINPGELLASNSPFSVTA